MCLILIAERRIPEESIRSAYALNSDGGGIAWRSGECVCWRKGLSEEELVKLSKKVPTPYIIHTRTATSGGTVRELTHPFPLEENIPLDLTGKTTNGVIFHNGIINRWEDIALQAVIMGAIKLPDPPLYSDTRIGALLVLKYGENILSLLGGKWVIFKPDTMIRLGEGWVKKSWGWSSGEIYNFYSKGTYIKEDKEKKWWEENWTQKKEDDYGSYYGSLYYR